MIIPMHIKSLQILCVLSLLVKVVAGKDLDFFYPQNSSFWNASIQMLIWCHSFRTSNINQFRTS